MLDHRNLRLTCIGAGMARKFRGAGGVRTYMSWYSARKVYKWDVDTGGEMDTELVVQDFEPW